MDSTALTVRRIRLSLWAAALVLGALYTWASRYGMSPDVIDYLDMGDAFVKGDWRNGLSGLWSPLYPLLLGSALRLFRPSPYWEFFIVHVVFFATFVAALAAFDFFLRSSFRYFRRKLDEGPNAGLAMLPEAAWVFLGLALFVWFCFRSVFFTIPISPGFFSDEATGGDLLGCAFVFLAAGVLYRLPGTGAPTRSFVALGSALGLGYLARGNILAWAAAALAASAILGGGIRRSLRNVVVAALVMLAIALPLLVGLSVMKGRPTLGDTAKFNYLIQVNGVPKKFWPWEGRGAMGSARHPVRRILSAPAVYEFGRPVAGTYPPGYDPMYWYEGMAPRLDLPAQLRVVRENVDYLLQALNDQQPLILAAAALLIFARLIGPKSAPLASLRDGWVLLALSCWGFATFMWVGFEMRYAEPFFLLGWMGIFALVRLPTGLQSGRLVAAVLVPALALLSLPVAYQSAREVRAIIVGRSYGTDSRGHPMWVVADALRRAGIQRGEGVAILGPRANYHAYWARLARVKIVAEVPDDEAYWKEDARGKDRVMRALASTAARVVVTKGVYPDVERERGWTRIASTPYFAYFLSKQACGEGPDSEPNVRSNCDRIPGVPDGANWGGH